MNIIKNLHFKEKLNNYFEIIQEKIIKSINMTQNQYEAIYKQKVKDYVMTKIYDKIYPSEPSPMDYKIYQKSIDLSWVEPQLLITRDYIFDNMLPDIINEFNKINAMKTPDKKLNSMRKIISYVENLIKFNEGEDKEIGAEDITTVLNYVFIKAHPLNIYSDIEFIKLFSNNDWRFENSLVNIESICNIVLDSTAETFNLTQEEYIDKIKEARNTDENK